jgi:hypothetical protein
MKTLIHHVRTVRAQPEEVRRHILHVATIVCAVILLALWIYSLGTNFASSNSDENVKKESSGLQPLSVLKENIIGGYNSISNPDPELEMQ